MENQTITGVHGYHASPSNAIRLHKHIPSKRGDIMKVIVCLFLFSVFISSRLSESVSTEYQLLGKIDRARAHATNHQIQQNRFGGAK